MGHEGPEASLCRSSPQNILFRHVYSGGKQTVYVPVSLLRSSFTMFAAWALIMVSWFCPRVIAKTLRASRRTAYAINCRPHPRRSRDAAETRPDQRDGMRLTCRNVLPQMYDNSLRMIRLASALNRGTIRMSGRSHHEAADGCRGREVAVRGPLR